MDFKELAAFGTGVPHTGTQTRRKQGTMGRWQDEEADTTVHGAKLQTATKLPRPLRLFGIQFFA